MDKTVLFSLSYGLYIITSKEKENFSGCIVNTVTQITAEEEPKLIVAVNKENYTSHLMGKSKKVNISILSEKADMLQIGKFGFRTGKEINKLEGTEYIMGTNQIPIVTQNAVGYLECDILEMIDCSTHYVFILEVQEAKKVSEEKQMTYDYYHNVIKGKTPQKASSYVK